MLANSNKAKSGDVTFDAIMAEMDRHGRCVDEMKSGSLVLRLYERLDPPRVPTGLLP